MTRIPSFLGLAATLVFSSSSGPTLRPGSAELTGLRAGGTASFPVWRRRAGDSVPRALARMTWSATPVPGDSDALTVVTSWSAPVSSDDSLTIDRHTFAPRSEGLASPALRFQYRYDGRRVTGSIQHGDSAPQKIVREFDGPVFAFNEVAPLVRSIPFRTGASWVVPLFSEADADLELDTITVVTDTTLAGVRAWIVRFADPVIVQRYVVDAASRTALGITTTQRKSGTVFVAAP